MKSCALIAWEDQHFSLEDVEIPDPAPDQIRIKTHYSGVSIGTEFAYITGKIAGTPHPVCTGYQGTGTVEAVGAEIINFREGDEVYFRCGESIILPAGRSVTSAFGVHASRAVLKPNTTHGAYHLIEGADMETASLYVMPAVGLYGVDMANPRMGETVVVYGCGLIGLGVIAALVHRGCVVAAVDKLSARLKIAGDLGADYLIDASSSDVKDEVLKITPDGADVVFESTGNPDCIDPSIELCRRDGSYVWQGYYGTDPISMRFPPPHGRRLKMYFPCDDGLQPCRRAVLKNMTLGSLQWERCITHRVDYTDADKIFGQIKRGDETIVGVTVNWTEA